MTSVCNTIGTPLKDIKFAVNPIDKVKLALNIVAYHGTKDHCVLRYYVVY
jgi:hypothetical protein